MPKTVPDLSQNKDTYEKKKEKRAEKRETPTRVRARASCALWTTLSGLL